MLQSLAIFGNHKVSGVSCRQQDIPQVSVREGQLEVLDRLSTDLGTSYVLQLKMGAHERVPVCQEEEGCIQCLNCTSHMHVSEFLERQTLCEAQEIAGKETKWQWKADTLVHSYSA